MHRVVLRCKFEFCCFPTLVCATAVVYDGKTFWSVVLAYEACNFADEERFRAFGWNFVRYCRKVELIFEQLNQAM